MVSQAELEAAIRQKVDRISALVVSDVSGGCGQAYDVIIVSDVFEGMNTLKRHRMVNDLLKEQIAQLHAFSQKTYTSQQYEALSGTPPSQPSNTTAATAGAAAGLGAATAAATGAISGGAGNQSSQASLGSGLPSARPATLDTSVAQRGSKVHHRTTSSNVSVPELILTPDAGDSKSGTRGGLGHARQRSLTPNTHNADMGGSSLGSPSGGSGVSRLHYAQITDIGFWTEMRDFLERRFMRSDDGSTSPSASPGRPRGESELVKVFEDIFQSQKQHMSGAYGRSAE